MVNISSWFSSFFSAAEADVISIVTQIKQDVEIAEADVVKALQWVADNAGTITSDIQQVLGVVQILGISNPAVETAVTAANSAVNALNVYAAAVKNGTGTPQAVVQGYTAYKQAQQAAAGAMAAVVSAPAPVQSTPTAS
jgi:hypothetical protein